MTGRDGQVPVLGYGLAREDETQGESDRVAGNEEGDEEDDVSPDADHVQQAIVEHQQSEFGRS